MSEAVFLSSMQALHYSPSMNMAPTRLYIHPYKRKEKYLIDLRINIYIYTCMHTYIHRYVVASFLVCQMYHITAKKKYHPTSFPTTIHSMNQLRKFYDKMSNSKQ